MKKNKENDIQLEELQKEEIEESKKPLSRKIVKPVIDFDAYFAKRLKEDSKIMPHHKAPMKAFAKQYALMSGTLEEFERLFRNY